MVKFSIHRIREQILVERRGLDYSAIAILISIVNIEISTQVKMKNTIDILLFSGYL